MYLYYDKTRTLKTVISHGEPIRQNSDVNIFVCLDEDFFDSMGVTENDIYNSVIETSVTYENKEFGTNGNFSETPSFSPFEKINTSEITYYLKNGELYWTYQIKFDAKQISVYPGKIYLNAKIIIKGERYTFGVADLFVEARSGLPSVDDSISQTEYDNFNERLSELTSRVIVLEQNNSGNTGGGIVDSEELNNLTKRVTDLEKKAEQNGEKILELEEEVPKLREDFDSVKIATNEQIKNLFK